MWLVQLNYFVIYYGVPLTKIYITSRVSVSDGGVDAKIDDDVDGIPEELLVISGAGYQLKTGPHFIHGNIVILEKNCLVQPTQILH